LQEVPSEEEEAQILSARKNVNDILMHQIITTGDFVQHNELSVQFN